MKKYIVSWMEDCSTEVKANSLAEAEDKAMVAKNVIRDVFDFKIVEVI